MAECTKCGHDPSTVKADPLQMLLAASMLIQRVKNLRLAYIRHVRARRYHCEDCRLMMLEFAGDINAMMIEFRNDSKGSTNQIERK